MTMYGRRVLACFVVLAGVLMWPTFATADEYAPGFPTAEQEEAYNAAAAISSPCVTHDDVCDEEVANFFDDVDAQTESTMCAVATAAHLVLVAELAAENVDLSTMAAGPNCNGYHQYHYRPESKFEKDDTATNGSYSHKIRNVVNFAHCSFVFSLGMGTNHNDQYCEALVELIQKHTGKVRPGTKFSDVGGKGTEVGGYFQRQPGYPICQSRSGYGPHGGFPNAPWGEQNLYAGCYYIYG